MPPRPAEQKKTRGKDEGRSNKAASSQIAATAGSDARCALCSRRFISKHALRIHLTRNATCRRMTVSTFPPSTPSPPSSEGCARWAACGALNCHEWSGADLIACTVLQYESARAKSCMGHRAAMQQHQEKHQEKHQFASLPGPRVLLAPAGFPTMMPTLPTLPFSVPVMPLAGSQQQSERTREVDGGGTDLSEKRSHLKRQLKVPTKLQGHDHHQLQGHHHQMQGKEREPVAGGEKKIYKRGLFEKRLKQLVLLSPQPPIPLFTHAFSRSQFTSVETCCAWAGSV